MKKETLGQRLRRLRHQAGLQQSEAVAALSVEIQSSQLSKIETDKSLPSWPVMCALSDLYGVAIDYIRFGDEISLVETPSQLVKNSTEFALLRAWRAMDEEEKRALALFLDKFGPLASEKDRVA
ncbi:helix-turn-helix domain-containing protein [Aristophania vespae]|uniref:Helix-turn-helix domain-containing protein n=1 Tax=Aristophania vespae TaxID=2697033 RepID=A0A6P1NHW7_9PROT|nr:helix-turn-helix domain-containing protein [Aristophania vespae]QHI96130.1 helix-turn-helix domain-containing protein [Aristophania vespae]UMM63909.1 hypothetical protein DM15PD_08890 [Aristophania vespae]